MFNTTQKQFYKSTTCGASVFVAIDLFEISSQTTSFLVLSGRKVHFWQRELVISCGRTGYLAHLFFLTSTAY